MSIADQLKWDSKFRNKPMQLGAPEPVLQDFLVGSPPQPILDFACGDGRNLIQMARQGFDVRGWDCSNEGLKRLKLFALEEGLAVNVEMVDFDNLSDQCAFGFGSVWISHYLPTVDQLQWLFERLPMGGGLCLITFNKNQPNFNQKFCLRPNQFKDLFGKQNLLNYESRIDNGLYHDFYLWKK